MAITSLAVFCGSREGKDPLFCVHARQLGYLIAEKNITLIYGGSNHGIMGAVANAVLEKNGKVMGIIPKVLTHWEHQHKSLTELYEVQDMHYRKKMMYEKCDAAIILAGGYGTMDEFFEMITWNQLNIHNKKIVIINTAGFYDHLLKHLQVMEEQHFLYNITPGRLSVISSPEELILD